MEKYLNHTWVKLGVLMASWINFFWTHSLITALGSCAFLLGVFMRIHQFHWPYITHYKAFTGGSIGKASIFLFSRMSCGFKSYAGRKASRRCMWSATLWAWGMGTESCSLRAFLREPPCRTCKKDQACIRLQEYLRKPRSKQTNKQKLWKWTTFNHGLDNMQPTSFLISYFM